MPTTTTDTTPDGRHPLWKRLRDRDAEAQADWYETLRDTAILRGLSRDAATAEHVWERQFRGLPSEDIRLWLRQWAIALRDETAWNPSFPVVIADATESIATPARRPNSVCPHCGVPMYSMHMTRHINKRH